MNKIIPACISSSLHFLATCYITVAVTGGGWRRYEIYAWYELKEPIYAITDLTRFDFLLLTLKGVGCLRTLTHHKSQTFCNARIQIRAFEKISI